MTPVICLATSQTDMHFVSVVLKIGENILIVAGLNRGVCPSRILIINFNQKLLTMKPSAQIATTFVLPAFLN